MEDLQSGQHSPAPGNRHDSIVALHVKRGVIGMAHYSSQTLCLVQSAGLEQLKQLEPTLLLSHGRCEEDFLHKVKEFCINREIDLVMTLAGEFSLQNAQQRILTLKPCQTQRESYLWLGGKLDLDKEITLMAAGALIGYLQKMSLQDFSLQIVEVREWSGGGFMHISQDAFSALGILGEERHPNSLESKQKDGISLFGILDHTCSPMGKSLLKNWFLRPLYDEMELQQRLDAVEMLMAKPEVRQGLFESLRGTGNVVRWLQGLDRLEKGEWSRLQRFCMTCVSCQDLLTCLPSKWLENFFFSKVLALDDDIRLIALSISETLEDGKVKMGVDGELDAMRRTYAGLDHLLTTVAQDLMMQGWPKDLSVVYFPQLGYLIALNQDVQGWQCQFQTNGTKFYKNDRMGALDQELGDVWGFIQDREIEIVQRLVEYVQERVQVLQKACQAIANLECILSFSLASTKWNYCRPEFCQERVLEVVNGRHPLWELQTDVFVANNVNLDKMMLLTGPNASGKSVQLKQVGLIAYMAHLGCFVPASQCRLKIVDKILTRLESRETVSKITSPFVNDLQQVARILDQVTDKSLVLMDEFGKGTTPCDGSGLLRAVIERLDCRGVAVSHFESKQQSEQSEQSEDSKLLKSTSRGNYEMWRMETMGDTCLYRLVPGICTESRAARVARMAGIRCKFLNE